MLNMLSAPFIHAATGLAFPAGAVVHCASLHPPGLAQVDWQAVRRSLSRSGGFYCCEDRLPLQHRGSQACLDQAAASLLHRGCCVAGSGHCLAVAERGLVAAVLGMVAGMHDLVAGKLALGEPGVEAKPLLSGGLSQLTWSQLGLYIVVLAGVTSQIGFILSQQRLLEKHII